jgi:hypothetical protein
MSISEFPLDHPVRRDPGTPQESPLPLSLLTTFALIERCRLGFPDARDLFVERFDAFVRSTLAKIFRRRPLARSHFDDAYQMVWERWFQENGGEAKADRSFGDVRKLLYTIALRVVQWLERQHGGHHGPDDFDPSGYAVDSEPHYRADCREEYHSHAREALRTMTEDPDPEVRRLGSLITSRFDGLSLPDIARQQDLGNAKHENEKAKAVFEDRILAVVVRYYRVSRQEARDILVDLLKDAT